MVFSAHTGMNPVFGGSRKFELASFDAIPHAGSHVGQKGTSACRDKDQGKSRYGLKQASGNIRASAPTFSAYNRPRLPATGSAGACLPVHISAALELGTAQHGRVGFRLKIYTFHARLPLQLPARLLFSSSLFAGACLITRQ